MEDDDGLIHGFVGLDIEIDAQVMISEEQLVVKMRIPVTNLHLNMVPVKLVTDEKEFCEEHIISQRISLIPGRCTG